MVISLRFFIIIILSVIIYWALPKQFLRNLVLITASYAFIFLADFKTGIFVFALSLFTYFCAYLLERKKRKILFHRIGVVILVLILILFKYAGLVNDALSSVGSFSDLKVIFSFENLFIPLGISYIIFKYIGYITDIYWDVGPRGKFTDLLAYGSFFTIFVAGPIEKFRNFQPQIIEKKTLSLDFISSGAKRIIIGLFKKAVIANWIGFIIAPYLENIRSYDFITVFLILIGFSINIYADFSGYSDIAIGSSKLFGLKISENFNYPYFKNNISMFWQSWHITLSRFIRDYLFMPLNSVFKNNFTKIIFVPLFAMGICGLWHGAELHFLMWGIMHAVGISVYQIWKTYIKKHFKFRFKRKLRNIIGIIITYIYVTLAWYWFI